MKPSKKAREGDKEKEPGQRGRGRGRKRSSPEPQGGGGKRRAASRRGGSASAAGAQAPAADMIEYYNILKKRREAERAHAIAHDLVDDPTKQRRLEDAIVFRGTCQEMCAEFERVERIVQRAVDACEKARGPDGVEAADQPHMVKRFRRSAAGDEAQLPSDVRTPSTLRRTLDYLVDDVVGGSGGLVKVHAFVWDRTRSIRNDFTLQNVEGFEDADLQIAIECYEIIARFHIHVLHEMSRPSRSPMYEFVAYNEREQLNKTLMSLVEFYDICAARGLQCAKEAEFRSYRVIFHLNNPHVEREVRALAQQRPEIYNHAQMQLAMELYELATNSHELQEYPGTPLVFPTKLHQFFERIKSDDVWYTMACMAEIHFNIIRKNALTTMRDANNAALSSEHCTLAVLVELFGFDRQAEAWEFCRVCGMTFAEDDRRIRSLQLGSGPSSLLNPNEKLSQPFSEALVECKRGGRTLPQAIYGVPVQQVQEFAQELFVPQEPSPPPREPTPPPVLPREPTPPPREPTPPLPPVPREPFPPPALPREPTPLPPVPQEPFLPPALPRQPTPLPREPTPPPPLVLREPTPPPVLPREPTPPPALLRAPIPPPILLWEPTPPPREPTPLPPPVLREPTPPPLPAPREPTPPPELPREVASFITTSEDGLLDQLIQHILPSIVVAAEAEHDEEVARDFRSYVLSQRYCARWKYAAEQRAARRRGLASRARMRQFIIESQQLARQEQEKKKRKSDASLGETMEDMARAKRRQKEREVATEVIRLHEDQQQQRQRQQQPEAVPLSLPSTRSPTMGINGSSTNSQPSQHHHSSHPLGTEYQHWQRQRSKALSSTTQSPNGAGSRGSMTFRPTNNHHHKTPLRSILKSSTSASQQNKSSSSLKAPALLSGFSIIDNAIRQGVPPEIAKASLRDTTRSDVWRLKAAGLEKLPNGIVQPIGMPGGGELGARKRSFEDVTHSNDEFDDVPNDDNIRPSKRTSSSYTPIYRSQPSSNGVDPSNNNNNNNNNNNGVHIANSTLSPSLSPSPVTDAPALGKDEEEAALFAKIRRLNQAMDEDIAFYREEIQKEELRKSQIEKQRQSQRQSQNQSQKMTKPRDDTLGLSKRQVEWLASRRSAGGKR